MTQPYTLNVKQGFTLIEISIVLVIIGLIIGGILVGSDMIKQAKIRKVLSEIDQYNAAISAFKMKYGGVPGDIPNPDVFFSFSTAGEIAACSSDNDGGINSQESKCFWFELGESGLISFKVLDLSPTPNNYGVYGHEDLAGQSLPKSAYSDVSGYKALTCCGDAFANNVNTQPNHWVLASEGGPLMSSCCYRWNGGAVTPADAQNMDTKIDDGLPNNTSTTAIAFTPNYQTLQSKRLIAVNGRTKTSNTAQNCFTNSSTYSVTNTDTACALRFLMN